MSQSFEISVVWINNCPHEVNVTIGNQAMGVLVKPQKFSEIQSVTLDASQAFTANFEMLGNETQVILEIMGFPKEPRAVNQCLVVPAGGWHEIQVKNVGHGDLYQMTLVPHGDQDGFVIVGTVELTEGGLLVQG